MGSKPILGTLMDRTTTTGEDGAVFIEDSTMQRGAGLRRLVATDLPSDINRKQVIIPPSSGVLSQGDADVTVTTAHSLVKNTADFTASRKVNLPTAASYAGRTLKGKAPSNANTYAQVLDPNGSEQIDGGSTLSIGVAGAFWEIYSDGTAWIRIA